MPEKMHTPEREIREKLWQQVEADFERAVTIIGLSASSRGKKAQESSLDALKGIVKLAYQSGLDRGFDMGYHLYGPGYDDADDKEESNG